MYCIISVIHFLFVDQNISSKLLIKIYYTTVKAFACTYLIANKIVDRVNQRKFWKSQFQNVSATNKIDNLTCVITMKSHMCRLSWNALTFTALFLWGNRTIILYNKQNNTWMLGNGKYFSYWTTLEINFIFPHIRVLFSISLMLRMTNISSSEYYHGYQWTYTRKLFSSLNMQVPRSFVKKGTFWLNGNVM